MKVGDRAASACDHEGRGGWVGVDGTRMAAPTGRHCTACEVNRQTATGYRTDA